MKNAPLSIVVGILQEQFASSIGALDEGGTPTRTCLSCRSRPPVAWYINGVCPFCGESAEIDEIRRTSNE